MRASGAVSVALLVGLVGCSRCGPTTKAGAIAKCIEVTGEVRAHPASELIWSAVGSGDELADGDWVRTAAASTAKIAFFSGAELFVSPESTVIIQTATSANEGVVGQVSVRRGSVRGVVRKKAKRGALVVALSENKSVRLEPSRDDTEVNYRLERSTDGALVIGVEQGTAALIGAGVPMDTLTAGDTRTVSAGPVPASGAHDAGVVASDAGPVPEDGGVDAPDAGPSRADLLLSPSENAVVATAQQSPVVTFRWAPREQTERYELVVAKDPGLERDVVHREETKGDRARTRGLVAGEYFWGVFAVSADGREPLFDTPRKLVVQRRRVRLRAPRKLQWK